MTAKIAVGGGVHDSSLSPATMPLSLLKSPCTTSRGFDGEIGLGHHIHIALPGQPPKRGIKRRTHQADAAMSQANEVLHAGVRAQVVVIVHRVHIWMVSRGINHDAGQPEPHEVADHIAIMPVEHQNAVDIRGIDARQVGAVHDGTGRQGAGTQAIAFMLGRFHDSAHDLPVERIADAPRTRHTDSRCAWWPGGTCHRMPGVANLLRQRQDALPRCRRHQRA